MTLECIDRISVRHQFYYMLVKEIIVVAFSVVAVGIVSGIGFAIALTRCYAVVKSSSSNLDFSLTRVTALVNNHSTQRSRISGSSSGRCISAFFVPVLRNKARSTGDTLRMVLIGRRKETSYSPTRMFTKTKWVSPLPLAGFVFRCHSGYSSTSAGYFRTPVDR